MTTGMLDSEFDTQVSNWMQQLKVPGVAVALVRDADLTSPEYRTFSAPGYPDISLNTRFAVASVTKLVSALALGHALDHNGQGFSFDTPVRDVLPDFKISNEEIAKQCTIGDLIGHRCRAAGYDNLVFQSVRDDMMPIVGYLPTSGNLGDQPSVYCQPIQQLTHLLVEKLTGETYCNYVRQTILEPYGMTSTGWSAEEAGNDLVDGYGAVHVEQGMAEKMLRFNHRAMDKLGEKSGMACMRLITTVQDMAALLRHLPDHPHWKYFSEPQLDPRGSVRKGGVLGEGTLGRGTIGFQLGDRLLVGHIGACAGFRCHVLRNDQLGVGIAVLTNSSEGWDLASCVAGWIVERLSGTTNLCEAVYRDVLFNRAKTRKVIMAEHPAIAAVDSAQLIGTFHSLAFGTLTFNASSNLPIRPACNITSIPWLPWLYGSIRPVVTSVGNGKFEGCLEWRPDSDQDRSWGEVVYGWPFLVELKDEEILVYGFGISFPGTRFDVPPAVFTRV